jgi:hypothetical protein
VLTLPFAASPVGTQGLLVPYWKPKPSTNYDDDLQVIQAALDDFDTQEPGPRLVYQLPTTRDVLLEDDAGHKQPVSMRLSCFVLRS